MSATIKEEPPVCKPCKEQMVPFSILRFGHSKTGWICPKCSFWIYKKGPGVGTGYKVRKTA